MPATFTLFTPEEAANQLGITRRGFLALAARHGVTGVKTGEETSVRLFTESDIRLLVELRNRPVAERRVVEIGV